MKAVNLIPTDAAPGGGRSGVGAYAVVGVLAVLVVMSSLYALAGRSVATKKQELAAVTAQANAADAQAATLKTYVDYADKRKARVETVKNLLASRFDWSSALDEVARTVPSGTWLTSLQATVTPAVTVGGSGAAGSLRGTLAVPAIDVSGCASGQQGVARTLTALRAMSGVQRVTLSTSGRAGDGSGSTASTPAGQSCSGAQFALTIFYAAPASSTATAATPTAPATASAAATPTTTGGSTP
jgi:Tfp pilus assembly protein PilN